MSVRVCVFDAYGTLFDVGAAARRAAQGQGWADRWPQLAADWRRKQLEYSWLRTIAGHHVDFWQVTGDALDWALEAAGLDGHAGLRTELMALYRALEAYPEVPEVLAGLRARAVPCAILSNGAPDMLGAAIASAGLEGAFDAVLSVEDVAMFKPARPVYDLVGTRFGAAPREVLFVSSNGWDICSGAAYGFRTLWVNRDGAPVDRLFAAPEAQLPDLTRLPQYLETL